AWLTPIREQAAGIVLELAGGLFTPLARGTTNADLAKALSPTWTVLVAPDRLGVLHDLGATTRAARAERLILDAIVLVTPPTPDELAKVADVPGPPTLPRVPVDDLARSPAIASVLTRLNLIP